MIDRGVMACTTSIPRMNLEKVGKEWGRAHRCLTMGEPLSLLLLTTNPAITDTNGLLLAERWMHDVMQRVIPDK